MVIKQGHTLLIFIATILLVVGGAYVYWSRMPKAESLVIPTLSAGCDQSATTTPCDALEALRSKPSEPTPVPSSTPTGFPFSFGPLKNVYKDKEFGFSLKYPDDLILSVPDCVSLNAKKEPQLFGIKVCNQHSPMSGNNPNARSLADYSHDYLLAIDKTSGFIGPIAGRVRIKKNREMTTASGAKGLEQVVDVEFFDPTTGTSTPAMQDASWDSQRRYVFYKQGKGVVVLLVFSSDPLEREIVQSVSY